MNAGIRQKMRSAVLLLALVCLFVALPCNTAEVHAAADRKSVV